MTNADKFKNLFGIYATELWSMPEKDFLKWLNSEVMNCSEIPNNSGTISRQAALDAIERIFDRCEEIEAHLPEGDPDRTGYKMYPDYVTVWKYLHQVPSAQSERTCVNCGRTINNGGWYADGRTRCPIEEHYALPKDGYCHLWEKRNVTDDDCPERREDEQVQRLQVCL